MKVTDAARTGLILVIVHLVLTVALWASNILRVISHATPGLLVRMLLGIVSAILLDVVLIILCIALSRTKEQQILDSSN